MKNLLHKRFLVIGSFALLATTAGIAIESGIHREIPLTSERELSVKLESVFGNIFISRGDPKKVLVADFRPEGNEHAATNIRYEIRNSIGSLDIDLNKGDEESDGGHDIQLGDFERGKWYLRLTDAVPLRVDAELACGRGEFDLSGLQMKNFKLSTGASSVTLDCSEPNRAEVEYMDIESGVGKLVATRLGNLNFRRLKFSGGVGSYDLDFSGEFRSEADVKIEVGLGAITVTIPDDVGAKVVSSDSWISKIHLDPEFTERGEDTYYTDNYSSARGRMNFKVEAGLGSVTIHRSHN